MATWYTGKLKLMSKLRTNEDARANRCPPHSIRCLIYESVRALFGKRHFRIPELLLRYIRVMHLVEGLIKVVQGHTLDQQPFRSARLPTCLYSLIHPVPILQGRIIILHIMYFLPPFICFLPFLYHFLLNNRPFSHSSFSRTCQASTPPVTSPINLPAASSNPSFFVAVT